MLPLLAALCAPAQMLERTRVMMGTFATIQAPAEKAACIEAAFARMQQVEKALSSYDPDADIARLNRTHDTAISPDTFEALRRASRYYARSGGYFDITVGSVTRGLYRFGEAERLPGDDELRAAQTGFASVEFNAARARTPEGITLDLGGFGKGFGVDKAIERLKQCGVTRGSVALSGDIRCLGSCDLAIENPAGGAPLLRFRTRMREGGISTSGTYRRYVKDETHHHLIDPKTKTPETGFVSVTLIGTADSSDLDAWTTAAAVMPEEKALAFLRSLPVAWVLVYPGGTLKKSPNLPEFIALPQSPEAPSEKP